MTKPIGTPRRCPRFLEPHPREQLETFSAKPATTTRIHSSLATILSTTAAKARAGTYRSP
ncbi:hypothetical protein [Nocardia mangyaensis]|uniref:hypothetical protein n=1 Tax=Nocardia mangyaensis TaxID=2213200 RepID=UPI00267708D6|nr:hypothetical protein [Nocardia mangyaensis]MDO3651213.1 hypothetical protein [Nocardia mangyaensis]